MRHMRAAIRAPLFEGGVLCPERLLYSIRESILVLVWRVPTAHGLPEADSVLQEGAHARRGQPTPRNGSCNDGGCEGRQADAIQRIAENPVEEKRKRRHEEGAQRGRCERRGKQTLRSPQEKKP